MAERSLSEAEDLREEAKGIRQQAESELAEARDKRAHVEKEAEEEMDVALARVRALVTDAMRELGNAPKPFGPKARALGERALREIRATPLGRRREEFVHTLHRGDEVYVPKLKERFRVHNVKKKNRTIVLIRGSLKMEIPFDDVTWV